MSRRNIPALFTLTFLIASTERAVKSACQGAVLFLGAEKAINALTFDWGSLVGFALGSAALSYLTSYATGALTDSPGPSAIGEKLDPTVG